MAKYEPLRAHLVQLEGLTWTAKLVEIESILGSRLPNSAVRHRTWWANSGGNLVHQNAWLEAGWRVDKADLARGAVMFRRAHVRGVVTSRSPEPIAQDKTARRSKAAPDLSRQHELLEQPVTVTLRAQWTMVGILDELSDAADWINDEATVLRMVAFQKNDPASVLISCGRLRQAIGALRSLAASTAGQKKLFSGIPAATGSAMEVHMLQPGNAWLLADGQSRKADLALAEERRMVAQLLLLQERQSGRGQKLLSL
ncbi:hypothetical protein [Roseibium sp.]|uniref:DUF7662 domain-containing protein n=1 Tax=Roseibium sp. TaxID=1936156 RepID=UPI003A97B6A1